MTKKEVLKLETQLKRVLIQLKIASEQAQSYDEYSPAAVLAQKVLAKYFYLKDAKLLRTKAKAIVS